MDTFVIRSETMPKLKLPKKLVSKNQDEPSKRRKEVEVEESNSETEEFAQEETSALSNHSEESEVEEESESQEEEESESQEEEESEEEPSTSKSLRNRSRSKSASKEPENILRDNRKGRSRSKTPEENKSRRDKSRSKTPKPLPEPEDRQRRSKTRSRSKEVTFAASPPRKPAAKIQQKTQALKATNGNSSRAARDKCYIQLQIHEIQDLGLIKYKRDFLTVTAVFNNEMQKSMQVALEIKDLSASCTFNWEISKSYALEILENPVKVARDILVTIKTEVDELSGNRPWTHVIGTAEIPGKEANDSQDDCRRVKLTGTELERGGQKMIYTVYAVIGKDYYSL